MTETFGPWFSIILDYSNQIQLMMKTKNLMLLFLAGAICFSGCKKDEEEEPTSTPTAAAPSNPIPAPTGADGALVAVHTVTYTEVPFIGLTPTTIGVAVAAFGNLTTGSFANAGAISLNGNALTAQTNNSYVYTPSATDIDGIDLSTNINWEVAGGNGFSAMSLSSSNEIPAGARYAGATTISRSAAFELENAEQIISADSVIYSLISPDGNLMKTVAGNIGSVNFTAAEMASLGAGSGYVQIAPYNIEARTVDGKNIYLVNEAVNTTSVTFQ